MNMKSAKVQSNEVVKATDINLGFESQIQNVAIAIQGIMEARQDFIIGDKNGIVQEYNDGSSMNIKVLPIFGICKATGIPFVETEITEPVAIEPGWSVNRIDTIEVRGALTDEVEEQRAFIDFETKQKTLQNVKTQKWQKLEINVKQNNNDGNENLTAPATSEGFVKIAEIVIPANAQSISECTIRNISTDVAGEPNEDWTNETSRTYNIGYITDVNARFRTHHNEDGTHRNGVIGKKELNLTGSDSNSVTGKNINLGDSVNLNGTSYATTTAITDMVKTIATKVSDLFNSYLKNGAFNFNGETSVSTILNGDDTLTKVLRIGVNPDGTAYLKLLEDTILEIKEDKLLVSENYETTTGITTNVREVATRAVTNALNTLINGLRTDVNYIMENIDPTAASNQVLSKFSVSSDTITAATTTNIALLGNPIIDGVSVTDGMFVLVKDQTDKKENGIYQVGAGEWSRATYSDAESIAKILYPIQKGTVNKNKIFFSMTDSFTIGENNIEFKEAIYSVRSLPNKVALRDENQVMYGGKAPENNKNVPTKLRQSGLDMNALANLALLADVLYPVGYVYTQYPGCLSPVEIGMYGTWEELQFGSVFFRSGGKRSLPFTGELKISSYSNNTEYNHSSSIGCIFNLDSTDTATMDFETQLSGFEAKEMCIIWGDTALQVIDWDRTYHQIVTEVAPTTSEKMNVLIAQTDTFQAHDHEQYQATRNSKADWTGSYLISGWTWQPTQNILSKEGYGNVRYSYETRSLNVTTKLWKRIN